MRGGVGQVGNMTAPYDEMAHHAPNAGFETASEDRIEWPALEYPSSAQFAGDMAVVWEACRDEPQDFVIMKADWRRYYRQALRAIWLCWLQGSMGSSAGISIDFRLVFGDSSNPSSMNWVQNILIWLARWLVGRAWGIDDGNPDTWKECVLQQPWATGRAREWMINRWTHFGGPEKGKTRTENVQLLFQAVPMALAGFFDDSFSGGKRQPCAQFEAALMRLEHELGVEASTPKYMIADAKGTIQNRMESGEWGEPEPGHPDILGKEFDLQRRVRRDTETRIATTSALLRMIVDQAKLKNRMVSAAAARRARGQAIFVTDQHPQHRCFLSGTSTSPRPSVVTHQQA